MKTTSGRTKPSRTKRSLRIHSMPSGARVQVRYGTSLKAGLEGFYKDYLKLKGFKKDSIVGNIMLVSKDGTTYEYRAYEEVGK